ncbi:MAG: UDP-N-acetylmuramoyl-L-alanine--D-glutamate ligase [Magnetococcales bacterium]|nr:UDP-N-acetylmuramoyl-L-alanine--D-glutamate ligase [Magnetococcales bacterium]
MSRLHHGSGSGPVAVAGLGLTGAASVRFLAALGVRVLACDEHPHPAAAKGLGQLPGVTLNLGQLPAAAMADCESVLLSPGIPRRHPALAEALSRGVPVINDIEWLYTWVNEQVGERPFIGITGTNGKSTVTTLVGQMLNEAGKNFQVGGNLGEAALSLWDLKAKGYVLELSSFQLESIDQFRAQVGVLLNLTPDHMDRYDNLAAYLEAKKRIFENRQAGDWGVVSGDDPVLLGPLLRELENGPGRLMPFSIQRPMPGGISALGEHLIDFRNGRPAPLMDLTRLRMVGRHNKANAAAATAVALTQGVAPEVISQVLETFPGLPHRMEWIRTLDGVPWYNDSKGTNAGAVAQSLSSLTGRVILIAGGRDKKGDFAMLAPLVRQHAEAVILMGEAAGAMEKAFAGLARIEKVGGMAEAVEMARDLAEPGCAVLLSPACASFDQFDSFEHRGDVFREAVHAL